MENVAANLALKRRTLAGLNRRLKKPPLAVSRKLYIELHRLELRSLDMMDYEYTDGVSTTMLEGTRKRACVGADQHPCTFLTSTPTTSTSPRQLCDRAHSEEPSWHHCSKKRRIEVPTYNENTSPKNEITEMPPKAQDEEITKFKRVTTAHTGKELADTPAEGDSDAVELGGYFEESAEDPRDDDAPATEPLDATPAEITPVTIDPVTEEQKRAAAQRKAEWEATKARLAEKRNPIAGPDYGPKVTTYKNADGTMGKIHIGPKPFNRLGDTLDPNRNKKNTYNPSLRNTQEYQKSPKAFDLTSNRGTARSPDGDASDRTLSHTQRSGSLNTSSKNPKQGGDMSSFRTVDDSVRPSGRGRSRGSTSHGIQSGSTNGSKRFLQPKTGSTPPTDDHNDPIVDSSDDILACSDSKQIGPGTQTNAIGIKSGGKVHTQSHPPNLLNAIDPRTKACDGETSRHFDSNGFAQNTQSTKSHQSTQSQPTQPNTSSKRKSVSEQNHADRDVDELSRAPEEYREEYQSQYYDAKAMNGAAEFLAKVINGKPTTSKKIQNQNKNQKKNQPIAVDSDEVVEEGHSNIKHSKFTNSKAAKESNNANEVEVAVYSIGRAFSETQRWLVTPQPGSPGYTLYHNQKPDALTLRDEASDKEMGTAFSFASKTILKIEHSIESSKVVIHKTGDLSTKTGNKIYLDFKEAQVSKRFVEKLTMGQSTISLKHLNNDFPLQKLFNAVLNQPLPQKVPRDIQLAQVKQKRKWEIENNNKNARAGDNSKFQRQEDDDAFVVESTKSSGMAKRMTRSGGSRDDATPREVHPQSFYGTPNLSNSLEPSSLGTRSSRRQQEIKEQSPPPPPLFRWTVKNPGYGENWTAALIYPFDPKIKTKFTVEKDDIEKLDDGEYLNDNLINFGMNWMMESADQDIRNHVFITNSYFYHKLSHIREKPGFNYRDIARWHKGVDIFKIDYIIVPVNENTHWYLAIICNPGKLLQNAEKLGGAQTEGADDAEPTETISTLQSAGPGTPESPGGTVGTKLGQLSMADERYPDSVTGKAENNSDDVVMVPSVIIRELAPNTPIPTSTKKAGKRTSNLPKFDPKEPRIMTLDSLGGSHSATCTNLKKYLMEESRNKKNLEMDDPGKIGMTANKIPMQPNFYDCGVFCLGYVRKFLENPDEFVRGHCQREELSTDWVDPLALRNELREFILKVQGEHADILENAKEQKAAAKRATKNKAAQSTISPGGLMNVVKNGMNAVKEQPGHQETKAVKAGETAGNRGLGRQETRVVETETAGKMVITIDDSPESTRSRMPPKSPMPDCDEASLQEIEAASTNERADEILCTPSPDPAITKSRMRGSPMQQKHFESPGEGNMASRGDLEVHDVEGKQTSEDPDLLGDRTQDTPNSNRKALSRLSTPSDTIKAESSPPRTSAKGSKRSKVINLSDEEDLPTNKRKNIQGEEVEKEISPRKRQKSPKGPNSSAGDRQAEPVLPTTTKRKNVQDDEEVRTERSPRKRIKSPSTRRSPGGDYQNLNSQNMASPQRGSTRIRRDASDDAFFPNSGSVKTPKASKGSKAAEPASDAEKVVSAMDEGEKMRRLMAIKKPWGQGTHQRFD